MLIKGVSICRSRNVVTNGNRPTPIRSFVIVVRSDFKLWQNPMVNQAGFLVSCDWCGHALLNARAWPALIRDAPKDIAPRYILRFILNRAYFYR